METKAPRKHRGVFAVLYRESPHWHLDMLQTFGLHVLSFQMMMGKKRWNVVGSYILPARTRKIEIVATALSHFPDMVYPILIRDLNVELTHMEGR